MAPIGPRKDWPGPEYVVRQRFHAPLKFVFDWCTDYSAKDASLEGERYTRRVILRETRRVVYEDLEESPDGWFWSRQVVTLRRPRGWHMESLGNRRNVVADYALTQVSPGVVELELRWRRRRSLMEFEKRPKSRSEREGRRGWKNFARALERDYRASKPPVRRGQGRPN
jgi:hypothetical protein